MPGENGRSAGDGERERHEPGGTTGLRDRDGVGEVREQRRPEHQHEHGEEAADHERTPAAPGGERRERHGEEREDGDRAGPPEHLGRQPVRPVGEDVELALVVLQRALELGRPGVHRDGLMSDRAQPERDEDRRHGDRREREAALGQLGPRERGARGHVPGERDQYEQRVGRVDERERTGRHREGCQPGPRAMGDVREEQRDHRGHEQLPARGRGQGERGVRPAVPRRQAEHRDLRDQHRDAAPRRPEHLLARLPGDEERDGDEQARLVQHDLRRVDAREPRDHRQERVPEREGVPRVEPAVLELVDRPERQPAEVGELPHAGEVEEVVPTGQVPGDRPERDPQPGPCGHDQKRL